MYFVTKSFSFESSHKLPNHPGKCCRMHGHSYKLEVRFSSKSLNSAGMVIDFGTLSNIVNPIVEQLDHSHLNDFVNNPTAERLLNFIKAIVIGKLDDLKRHDDELKLVFLYSLKLWETEKCFAEWIMNPFIAEMQGTSSRPNFGAPYGTGHSPTGRRCCGNEGSVLNSLFRPPSTESPLSYSTVRKMGKSTQDGKKEK